jgi:hypothetical protein
MRINKDTLIRVIHEEVRRGMLNEFGMQDGDPADLVSFADAWVSLGEVIQAQVKQILDGRTSGVNPQDIELAAERLAGFNADLDDALESYITNSYAESEAAGDGMHADERGDDDWGY